MATTRRVSWTAAVVVSATLAAGLGSALAGYTTGQTYTKTTPDYQLGYAAGVADLLTALQEQKLLKDGAFNDQAAMIGQCLKNKKIKQSQVRGAYLGYLKAFPSKVSDSAAPDVTNAMVIACQKEK
jgi:hypothetical protein